MNSSYNSNNQNNLNSNNLNISPNNINNHYDEDNRDKKDSNENLNNFTNTITNFNNTNTTNNNINKIGHVNSSSNLNLLIQPNQVNQPNQPNQLNQTSQPNQIENVDEQSEPHLKIEAEEESSSKSVNNKSEKNNDKVNNPVSPFIEPKKETDILVKESNNSLDFMNLNMFNQETQQENKNLKIVNQVLEKEVSLLKSLILINNLNLTSFESHDHSSYNNNSIYKNNYFVDMCNQEKINKIVDDDQMHKITSVLHSLIIKIKVCLVDNR